MNREFEDTSLKDGSDELFNTHNILEALLEKGRAENGPDRELYEQESRQINWLISKDEVNDDHTESDSQKSEVDQDINSVEIIVRSEIADKSSMDGLENNAEESNATKRIIR